jgi:hypothetical protein
MGEAPLGPAETGREIAEHAHRSREHDDTTHDGTKHHGTKHERTISIVEAALLALVALLAAWSGYAAAKWSTESRLLLAEASTTRNLSNTAHLEGLDIRLGDALAFNAWLAAHSLGNVEDEEIAARRFRPGFKVAFDAWLATNPDTNPDAPPGPQAMPEYVQPDVEKSERLREKGEEQFAEGSEHGEDADDYVRTTVYLATVLFLVGVSTQFPVRAARFGLIGVGVIILIFSIVQLILLPKPPL